MDDAALLRGKRSEVLKRLVGHLRERDDYAGLALLHELLELHNMQAQIIADLTADLLRGKR